MQRPKFSREFKLGAKCPPDISSFPSLSLTVVRTSLLRITPAKLIAYIRRPLDPAHAVNAELLLEYGALPVRTHHYAKPEPTAWSAQPFWLCEHELNARSPLPTPTNKGLTSRI